MTHAYTKQSRENQPIRQVYLINDIEIGILCGFCLEITGKEIIHLFPADWIFGGANELHPGADRRWKPTTYSYFNAKLEIIHISQTPLCDSEAVYEFAKVQSFGPGFEPVYIQAERPDKSVKGLPYIFDPTTGSITTRPAPGGEDDSSP